MRIRNLKKQYNDYLNELEQTGKHPHPSELLVLLLLPEKENYDFESGTLWHFYELYQEVIDIKINQVISDFNLTNEKIIDYIENKEFIGYQEEKYEYQKVMLIFGRGIEALFWGVLNGSNFKPEKIYDMYSPVWGKKPIGHVSRKKKKRTKKKNQNEWNVIS